MARAYSVMAVSYTHLDVYKRQPESPANETQPTPATHTRAAAMLKRVGRGPRSAHPRNGMITQYSDVRNALFEAVVSVLSLIHI